MYTLVSMPYNLFQDGVTGSQYGLPPNISLLVNPSGIVIARFSDSSVAQTALNALNT